MDCLHLKEDLFLKKRRVDYYTFDAKKIRRARRRGKTSPGNPNGGRHTWSNGCVPFPPVKGDNDPV